MNDRASEQSVEVREGQGYRYLSLPLDRLEEITKLLELHGVDHWASRAAVALTGKPYVIRINLGRAVDLDQVRSILDGQQ